MEKLELLEDMERKMLRIISEKEVPDGIKNTIREVYQELENIIRKYNNRPDNALEYMYKNFEYLENVLLKVNEEKINEQVQGVINVCRDMERKTVENEEDKNEDKEHLSEVIYRGNTRQTIVIIENLCDYIKDTLNRANYILSVNGYYDRDIENQTYEVRQLINQVETGRIDENIEEELNGQDKIVLAEILKQYEEYQEQVRILDERKQEEKQETAAKDLNEIAEEIFRKSLQEGAPSQEEQRKTSEEFVKRQEEKEQEEKDTNKILPLDPFVIE